MADFRIIDHAPRIFVAGCSYQHLVAINEYLEYRGENWNQLSPVRMGPMGIAELAGRVCYMSYENKGNKSTEAYLEEQIIAHGHESVIEHVWVNLMIADLPIHVQTELIRHRVGVAYSFESTRYTDKHLRFVVPPAIRGNESARSAFRHVVAYAVAHYQNVLFEIEVDDAVTDREERKRRTEAARSVLPVSRGSDGMVSMNLRAARHIILLRSADGADLSMREFAVELFNTLQPMFPPVFSDMQKIGHSSGVPVIAKVSK